MKPIEHLTEQGQSIWLDYIRRDFTRTGGLADLVVDGVRGVTSNPSIFEQAIGGSAEYDEALAAIISSDPDCSPLDLFESLAVVDIQEAADVLHDLPTVPLPIEAWRSVQEQTTAAPTTARSTRNGLGRPTVSHANGRR